MRALVEDELMSVQPVEVVLKMRATSSSARRGAIRARLLWLVAGFVTVMGCSGMGGGGGCAALQPIPSGRYTGPKSDNGLNLRLSAQGINYLNQNWQTLIEMFAPGRRLTIPVACTKPANLNVVGSKIAIADQGGANCNDENCGRMDGECNTAGPKADLPANVVVQITGFSLVPAPPDKIQAQLQLAVDTNAIMIASESQNFALCIGLSRFKCAVRFNTAEASPNDNRFRASVTFTIDNRWDKLLAFNISSFTGSDVCGGSNPPPPECLQPSDITFDGQNTCGNVYCGVADFDPVKNFVLGLISPLLQTQIKGMLATQSCEACGMGRPACPTVGTATSVCQNDVCKDAADNTKCVPRFLGMEGRLNLGATLGSFGAPADAEMDVSFAAGASRTVDQGLSFGTRVGAKAVRVAPCVAPAGSPPVLDVAAPNFEAEAPTRMLPDGGTSRAFHAAVGFSSPFLNVAFHEAQQAGALCLQLDTNNVGLINTGLFKTFLPSLGTLATRDGKDAPMMVVLRPGRAPTIAVGEGTIDPVTKRPLKPLIQLTLNELSIDFYAMIDDRYARLFTLTADIALPLSLIFEGCDKVTPAIGDLRMLITNVRSSNSEMLADDPKVLEQLIPAVIGLAEPALAGGLGAFSLPALGSFKLRVNGAKGVGLIAGTETYNHLALYAELLPAMAQCAVTAPLTVASLQGSEIPSAAEMRLVAGKTLKWPTAVLEVKALNKDGQAEFSVKIDDGLWSEFLAAEQGVLRVSHPKFLIQGKHVISVRSRVAEDQHGISAPVTVDFLVDWDGPSVKLRTDKANDRLLVEAHDVITADEALQFAYAVGDELPGPFGAAREISLTAVEAKGGVRVLVRDERGNVGEARYRVGTFARSDVQPVPEVVNDVIAAPHNGGCSAAPFGLPILAALVLRRRRALR